MRHSGLLSVSLSFVVWTLSLKTKNFKRNNIYANEPRVEVTVRQFLAQMVIGLSHQASKPFRQWRGCRVNVYLKPCSARAHESLLQCWPSRLRALCKSLHCLAISSHKSDAFVFICPVNETMFWKCRTLTVTKKIIAFTSSAWRSVRSVDGNASRIISRRISHLRTPASAAGKLDKV